MNLQLLSLSFFFIFLSGCSSTPKYIISSEWDEANLSELYIYRTNTAYHSLNPEKPFFYIDGKEIGKLGTGQSIYTKITSGNHVITAKEPILFMPAYENGSLQFKVEPNKKYYIRYSKDFSGISIVGPTVVSTDSTTLQMANKEYFQKRK